MCKSLSVKTNLNYENSLFIFLSCFSIFLHYLKIQPPFPPHDSSDAGSNPEEVVEFLRTEKFREQVLREGL
jgi:hypothetical protein